MDAKNPKHGKPLSRNQGSGQPGKRGNTGNRASGKVKNTGTTNGKHAKKGKG